MLERGGTLVNLYLDGDCTFTMISPEALELQGLCVSFVKQIATCGHYATPARRAAGRASLVIKHLVPSNEKNLSQLRTLNSKVELRSEYLRTKLQTQPQSSHLTPCT